MNQMEDNFGTEAYKLRRKASPETSVEASGSVDTTKLEKLVYKTILDFGDGGCIADDVLAKYPSYPYSSLTARFSALEKKGYIIRNGDKRKGRSGKNQAVMRGTSLKALVHG